VNYVTFIYTVRFIQKAQRTRKKTNRNHWDKSAKEPQGSAPYVEYAGFHTLR